MSKRILNYGLVLGGLLTPVLLAAQTAVDKTKTDIALLWLLNNLVLVVGLITVIGVLVSLFKINMMLLESQKIEALREHGIEVLENPELIQTTPMWQKIYDWALALVPESQESSIDLGHNYDGIRELDNKLPPWWLGMMYGSIIFAFIYMYHYHGTGSEWSSTSEYLSEMESAEKIKSAYLDKMANKVNENTVEVLLDEIALGEGKSIFDANCAACHGFKGEGSIGPNFTDKYWIHGGGIKNVFKTIKYGVPEKGMIAWKAQMGPAAMQKVASYILTLEGTDPPNQKAKEGKEWEPEEESEEAEHMESESK
jgi:cytochrome c oxidase cbb3-type subunit III